MVSIIENWASIEGVIVSLYENPDLQGFYIIELDLQRSEDEGGFPNLAKADEGKVIRINIRREQLETMDIKPGNPLRATVRKAYGQIYFIR
jgi:hypothetical protein